MSINRLRLSKGAEKHDIRNEKFTARARRQNRAERSSRKTADGSVQIPQAEEQTQKGMERMSRTAEAGGRRGQQRAGDAGPRAEGAQSFPFSRALHRVRKGRGCAGVTVKSPPDAAPRPSSRKAGQAVVGDSCLLVLPSSGPRWIHVHKILECVFS